ncbi:MAG TPA: GAF domain-containing sensor histidine kinase [Polyangiaceae bacterium]|nr:GAF domain-containing sensor histidine kinase [Polyangiaceae bacterium]
MSSEEELHFRHARLLLELSRATGADWGASIRHICQFEAQVLGVERVSYWSFYPEASALICEAGYVSSRRTFEQGARLLESEMPLYFRALREARIVDVEDVDTDARTGGLAEYCRTRGISSMLEIPVWAEGRLCGVLSHEQVGPHRRWTAAEAEFAMGVGQVVAAALAARTQTPAEAEARRAVFLDSVSRALLSSLNPRQIAIAATDLAVPKLADISNVWILTPDDRLDCIGSAHVDPSQQAWVMDAVLATTKQHAPVLASPVVRQRQSLLIPDTGRSMTELFGEVEPEKRAVFQSTGISAAMGIPLAVAGVTFGAMTFFAVGARHYDSDDLALAQDVASRLAAALENARVHGIAREAIAARDEFLILLSHELRTPLTSIKLMTDDMLRRAQRSNDPAEQTRCDSIARQVRRFCDVVAGVIEAMNIRAEGVSLTLATHELSTIVERVVWSVAERARRIGCPIALSLGSVVLRVDEARLERVVWALLDNAIKFGAGHPIDVSLGRVDGQAELTVRDRGPGIVPDRLKAIFSPFERAVPKEHFGGLGLGLYIANAIVRAHGGSIEVASPPGHGTTVVIRLPLAPTER